MLKLKRRRLIIVISFDTATSMKKRIRAYKNQQPDFGTYHHSTPRSSEKVRENIRLHSEKPLTNYLLPITVN